MNKSTIRNVTILGAGCSGQQIAIQFARFEFQVALYDVDQAALDRGRRRIDEMVAELIGASLLSATAAPLVKGRIAFWTNPEGAAASADLLCEAIPEDLELKRQVLRQFDALTPPSTLFTTNTSYLAPSRMAVASGRPEHFAAFHFHVPVWYANAVDVMPHRGTSPETIETLCRVARQIDQTPITLRRESPGYVFNTLLHPLLLHALDLAARDVTKFEDVDRSWMAITKMPIGPFGMLDKIGLDTVRRILDQWGKWVGKSQSQRAAQLLQEHVARKELGEKSGKGFYKYPNPAYATDDFIVRADRDSAEGTRRRLDLTLVEVPIAPRIKPRFRIQGRAAIWGDEAWGALLASQFEREGTAARWIPADTESTGIAPWFEEAWNESPLLHLFIAPPIDDAQQCVAERRLENAFTICQKWFELVHTHGLQDRATLLVVSRMGGTLGGLADLQHPEHGAYTGLAKAVSLESMSRDGVGLAVKAVDFSPRCEASACTARALEELGLAQASIVDGSLAECRRRQADVEVYYGPSGRQVVRYRIAQPEQGPSGATAPHGHWLVSGGVGGIVRLAAQALAEKYDLDLHLVGRTQVPDRDFLSMSPDELSELKANVMREAYRLKQKPNQAWSRYEKQLHLQQTLQALKGAGIRAEYHCADVADADAMLRLVMSLESTGRPVRGILHGAGVERTARFETKSTASMWETLRPKWQGASALFDATRSSPLEWFVVFSSLAGRIGGVGQVDYVMANDLQARLTSYLGRLRPECRFVTFDWPAWDEVGMAARPASRYALEHARHKLMPIREGLHLFLAEFLRDAVPTEAVIADPRELGPELMAHCS